MRTLLLIVVGSLWLILAAQNASAQNGPPVADEGPPAIDKWIGDLNSDIYTARERATERLIMAGSRSIEPVAKAVEAGGLETISRGIYILRQLALVARDGATEEAAYEALQGLSQRRFSGAARRATTALQSIHEMRHQRAELRLTQLGADFSMTPVQVALGVRDGFPSVRFGSTWQGTPNDFAQVSWITTYQSDESDQKWMIILEDQRVSDEWIDRIATIKNVAVLKIKSSQFDETALAKLTKMPDLEILELLYVPVTDAAIDSLAALPKVGRLRLIGSQITTAGLERLQQQIAQTDIDYRNGGFLGIGCTDNPCRITFIQPNSAAGKAGFQVDDIITRYNDQPVQTMDQLTRLISEHNVGDKVAVEVLRNDERIIQQIELGAWD